MPIIEVTATAHRVDPNRNRIAIVVRQKSGDPVFYGFRQNITGPANPATVGMPLNSNEVLILERDGGGVNHAAGPLWLVCAAGDTAEVYLEEQK